MLSSYDFIRILFYDINNEFIFWSKQMPEVILNGPHGRIECRYHPGLSPDSPIALILHPEPNQGGSMNNKVSYGMYHEFRNRGFSVLRFNFRGVGRSTGKYDQGISEIKDLKFIFDIFSKMREFSKIYIAGFSFGGHVAAQFAYNYKLLDTNLVLVATAISNFSTKNIYNDGILIQGAQDDLVNPDDVLKWNRNQNLNLHLISTSGHFFHNHLGALKKKLINYLKND